MVHQVHDGDTLPTWRVSFFLLFYYYNDRFSNGLLAQSCNHSFGPLQSMMEVLGTIFCLFRTE